MRRLVNLSWGLGIFLVASVVIAASSDPYVESYKALHSVVDDLATIGVKVETLHREYGTVDVTIRERRFSDRVTDAEILFLLNDFIRASLLLYDLVTEESNRSAPMYGKALYYLAESQFQIGNELASMQYFKELVKRRDEEYLGSAIERLIKISDRLETWDGLDAYVNVLAMRGPLPPDIAYIHAKSLLHQGRYQLAIDGLRTMGDDKPQYYKSRYLMAVAHLQIGQFRESEGIFKSLVEERGDYEDSDKVRDLSAMNRGRILLELGEAIESIDAYQYIKRNSPLFEEALYEITWTFIKNADLVKVGEGSRKSEYKKALRALEILLLSEVETKVTPEARLLLGNILLRLGRYDEAGKAFGDVVRIYSSVHAQLKEHTAAAKDPVDYYDTVANREKEGGEHLPDLAMNWMADDKSLSKALVVVKDLDIGEQWLGESSELIEELLGLVSSSKRVRFFPVLQNAQKRRMALENSLVHIAKRFVAVERALIRRDLPPNLQRELQGILEERARLEPAFQKLPKNLADYEGRVNRIKARVEGFQKQAYRLKWDIEEIRRELDGLRSFLKKSPGLLKPEELTAVLEGITDLEGVVKTLVETQVNLEKEIIREKKMISITNETEIEEHQLRMRYNVTLEMEREILQLGETTMVGQRRKALDGIKKGLQEVTVFRFRLESFGKNLREVMKQRALTVKAELLKEQSLVERHSQNLKEERGQAKYVVGKVAAESLEAVTEEVRNIILRADVGMIDVAWALKELQTEKITEKLRKQTQETGVLDSEWSGVLD